MPSAAEVNAILDTCDALDACLEDWNPRFRSWPERWDREMRMERMLRIETLFQLGNAQLAAIRHHSPESGDAQVRFIRLTNRAKEILGQRRVGLVT